MQFQSTRRFSDLTGLDDCTLAALRDNFGYEFMSKPQALYMQAVINGQDMLVRAGTGSGKTLGFLLPLVTTLLKKRGARAAAGPGAVILSPARELAEQTLEQAQRIASKCGLHVQGLIGGVRTAKADLTAMMKFGCDIVVATPGRLLDHIEHSPGFAAALRASGRVLVLDEVDRLLDPGFKPAMLKTSEVMSHPARQTLLFTATATAAVRAASRVLLHSDDAFVDAGADSATGSAGAAHNADVRQEALLVPSDQLLPALWRELAGEKAGHAIVFVQTAAMASLLAEVLRKMRGGVFEIHSRMQQSQRSRTVREFSASKSPAVIVATDVFARGIDVKGVTLVVQLGIAPDNAQVAHRVGRTGRGGATGRALMILDVREEAVLRDLVGREKMPITVRPAAPPQPLQLPTAGLKPCKAFIAAIGFYKSQVKRLGWPAADLVPNVARMFKPLGVADPSACPVPARTIKKMGLAKGHGLTEA